MKTYLFILILVSAYACQSSNPTDKSTAFQDVDVKGFSALMQEENTVILDVRTPGETQKGIIEGAVEIDILAGQFSTAIQSMDKDKTYLVYCQSGKRSVTACNQMAEAGFSNLYNLSGGYKAWSRVKQ
jgi:phage shock protein E